LKDVLAGKMIIDATVPIDPSNILQTKTETGKSAAEETADIIRADVFAAFQTISHRLLRNETTGDHDVLVGGPDNRKAEIFDFIRAMGLRPVDAGPLAIAPQLERMTPLLLSINKANKVKESGIKITGV
jgi:predicted dinucleotide-binding enzyme